MDRRSVPQPDLSNRSKPSLLDHLVREREQLGGNFELKNLDPALLMWDMRRNLKPAALPDRRCTVQFVYPEVDRSHRSWWLVVEGGKVDLCGVDPGYEVGLHVRASLRSMTAVWMGHSTLQREIDAGHIELIGDRALARSLHAWLGFSSFAKQKRRVA